MEGVAKTFKGLKILNHIKETYIYPIKFIKEKIINEQWNTLFYFIFLNDAFIKTQTNYNNYCFLFEVWGE